MYCWHDFFSKLISIAAFSDWWYEWRLGPSLRWSQIKLKIVLVWQGLTYNYLLLIVQAFQNSIPISIYWLSYFLSGQIFKLLREIRLIITDEIGAGIITDTIIFTAKCVYTTFAQTTNIAGSIKSDEKLSNYWTSWSWLLLYLNKDIL